MSTVIEHVNIETIDLKVSRGYHAAAAADHDFTIVHWDFKNTH